MKKYLMVVLMVFASSAMAKIGYVDEYQKGIDLKVDALTKQYEKECKGKYNSNVCKSQARAKARFEFSDDFRGRDKYNSEHYGNLSRDQAVAKLHELIKLYDVVNKDDKNPEYWSGKLNPLTIDREINYILAKYFPTQIDTCGKICAELLLRQIGK